MLCTALSLSALSLWWCACAATIGAAPLDGSPALAVVRLSSSHRRRRRRSYTEVVKLLVDAGADPFERTVDGVDALVIARARGHRKIVEYLSDIEPILRRVPYCALSLALCVAAPRRPAPPRARCLPLPRGEAEPDEKFYPHCFAS